jgi:hypothetical protein
MPRVRHRPRCSPKYRRCRCRRALPTARPRGSRPVRWTGRVSARSSRRRLTRVASRGDPVIRHRPW